mmetsp:Transcript_7799/g.14504  ORF Transcript_7799/g.14504 Transcript_7799/m.14504 type:complete len:412 (+) Transcript_7799:60-1295(+)
MSSPLWLRLLSIHVVVLTPPAAAVAKSHPSQSRPISPHSGDRNASLTSPRRLSAVCTGTFAAASTLATGAGIVRALAYVPHTTKMLVAAGDDQVLRVWTLDPFSATASNVLNGHAGRIWSLQWVDTHNLLASGSNDGTIRFWSPSVLMNAQTCHAQQLANCCDGDGLGCEGEHVVSWRDLGMQRRYKVHGLLWVTSSAKLYSAWEDLTIRIWTYNGAGTNPSWSPSTTVYTSTDRVHDMAYLTGSGGFLATASPDERAPRLWAIGSGSATLLTKDVGDGGFGLCPWAHCDAVLATASLGAETLATGSMDNRIIIWSSSTMNRLSDLTSHTDYVSALAHLDSDTKIASGSKDNKIRIWSLADTSVDQTSSAETLSGHTGQVNALVWMGNAVTNGQLVSGSSDGTVRLWTCTR